jgi:predicted ATPase/class 3 adenylate cyclase
MPGRGLPSGTTTFLFSDIEGSTRLVEKLGPGWPRVLEGHRRALRRAFDRHGGVEMGTEGDSFFVAFDDASAAVAAAVDGQRGLAEHRWPDGAEVLVRIGLHTGRGQVVRGDYVGIDVHRAARVAAAAHGGQVILSDSTRALTEHNLPHGVDLLDLGFHRLKDIPDSEHLFQLVIPGLPTAFPPLRTVTQSAGNLPVPLTTFVGREREIAEVRELLRTSHLLTLIGPAGTGKTRLIIESARGMVESFRDDVWFVDFASVVDPRQMPAAIASAVGVREVGGKPMAAVLADHFGPRTCLVILDNLEQLLPGAPLLTELLAAAPGLTVAATSQAELRLSGERLYSVPPMGGPAPGAQPIDGADLRSDGARLFVERAMSGLPDLTLDARTSQLIGEICARLDGLPLAIELAAARVHLLGIEGIARRLDNRLALLSAGSTDVPARHRTLRGAIAWSHDLLTPAEAVQFRRLAVFSGGADLAAIERVCFDGIEDDPLDALDGLLRHSLIQADPTVGGRRYQMFETIREYARERLSESGESSATQRRHANWYAELLESLAPIARLRPAEARIAEPEIDNIESALRWAQESGDIGLGLRICGSAWRVWERQRRIREGLTWTREFLARGGGDELARPRLRALEAAGAIAYWLGDQAAAAADYRERLALASRLGLEAEVADANVDLWFALANLGDFAAAGSALAAARAGYESVGDELGVARCRWIDASLLARERRFAEARPALEADLLVFREHGDVNYAGLAMGSLAMCAIALGDLASADAWFRELLDTAQDATTVGAINGLGVWSRMLGYLGHPRLAARLQGAYAALSETYGIEVSAGLMDVVDLVLAQVGQAEELELDERQRLFDEGRRLTIDEAIDAARAMPRAHEQGISEAGTAGRPS